ncbi:Acg family FMN-binding oxidoreductase [Saccharopolyspora phatthalungensis]|uniref:Nitroreductase n=1 Tax=Saccharopolyspora phatthalungensis TaxID=664693 RepID=A0A840QG85_9PSEU|nr:nitroreductase family protein [Saccharopolyspora phatthalungensis]MBB5157525.1 nitroreductase [Saccharopolyspora phatthalungensis]
MRTFPTAFELTTDQMEQIIRRAGMAPSLHNSQPWRFRILPHLIELHADPKRRLPAADPEDRELRLACGAALFNLRLALEHAGIRAVVTLLPHLAAPTALAEVRSGGQAHPRPEDTRLYEAIAERHSHRQPFRSTSVSTEDRHLLMHAAHEEHAWLHVVQPGQHGTLEGLVHRAHRVQMANARFRAELDAWVGRTGDTTEGVPVSAAGPKPEPGDQWVHRDFTAGQAPRSPGTEFEAHPLLVVLCSRHGSREADLQAGQALQRLWLTATAQGLAASMISQVVEVRETREELRELLGGNVTPQALLRIGHGTPSVPSPRRNVEDMLVNGVAEPFQS